MCVREEREREGNKAAGIFKRRKIFNGTQTTTTTTTIDSFER